MFDLTEIKNAIGGLSGQVQELRRQIETAKREREDIANAPVSREDTISLLCGRIDSMGSDYPANLTKMALSLAENPRLFEGCIADPTVNLARSGNSITPLNCRRSGMTLPQLNDLERVLAAILGDQVKALMKAVLETMDWPKNAISIEDRKKRLTKLDKEIANLEKQEAELVETARSAGLSL